MAAAIAGSRSNSTHFYRMLLLCPPGVTADHDDKMVVVVVHPLGASQGRAPPFFVRANL